MAKGAYLGIDGKARKVAGGYIGVNGVARKITKAYIGVNGVAQVWWMPEEASGPIILEVEKITSNTYAGETTYNNEQFVLLDIYPKTNGTVSITYGSLTKTITDTSGAVEPNAQRVYFGTYNGVSDSVETPASGTLTIEGDCRAFGVCLFSTGKLSTGPSACITSVKSFGHVELIPSGAFMNCSKLSELELPQTVLMIYSTAFVNCDALKKLFIPASVTNISGAITDGDNPCFVEIDSRNKSYKIDGNAIIEIATNTLIDAFSDTVIPDYIEAIAGSAFSECSSINSVVVPSGVTYIGGSAFSNCTGLTNVTVLATTPPTLGSTSVFTNTTCTITVPAGCGEAYKAAEGWSEYADRIVEG